MQCSPFWEGRCVLFCVQLFRSVLYLTPCVHHQTMLPLSGVMEQAPRGLGSPTCYRPTWVLQGFDCNKLNCPPNHTCCVYGDVFRGGRRDGGGRWNYNQVSQSGTQRYTNETGQTRVIHPSTTKKELLCLLLVVFALFGHPRNFDRISTPHTQQQRQPTQHIDPITTRVQVAPAVASSQAEQSQQP